MYQGATLTLRRACWFLVAVVMLGGCQDGSHVTVDGGDDRIDAAVADAQGDAMVDAPTDAPVDGPEGPMPVRLRVVASNLTSGNSQSYEAPGIRILDGLDADIALIQEFNVGSNSVGELRSFVDQAFGPTFSYFRQPVVPLATGVVSRYPIMSVGVWDDPQVANRDFVWARIDVPGPRDVWAVSVHLLPASPAVRSAEADALVGFIQANVPADDFLVVGGNLNPDIRTEPCITTLGAVVSTAGPYPADQAGNDNTNASRLRPYDWVLADADLRAYEVAVTIGAASFPAGLVFDTRVYAPLVDVAPALATDSGAPGMQHMAVIRDFVITD